MSELKVFLLSGLLLGLAACGGGGGGSSDPSGGPTPTQTPSPPTTPTPSVSPTSSPLPTVTPSPSATPSPSPGPTIAPEATPMPRLSVNGRHVVDENGEAIWLRGIAFGNEVWQNTEIPSDHHGEEDFRYVADMGMNVVRFYFNYRTLEDDNTPYQYKETGWAWFDQNIEWARENGIYLILNAHIPQGGFQSGGEGDALWNVEENQNRLVAMYREIADRYKDDTTILGFDLVNEPYPTESRDQWEDLAQRLVTEIRDANQHHIIIVERTHSIKNGPIYDATGDNYMFLVDDDNILYTFHFYEPFLYTHQRSEEDWQELGETGPYPDDNRLVGWSYPWQTASFDSPALEASSTEWQYFEGQRLTADAENFDFASVALVSANNNGRVYFDNVVVKEYDESGAFVRDVFTLDLDSLGPHQFYSADGSGNYGVETAGQDGSSAIFIEGTSADSNLTTFAQYTDLRPGYSYSASGWIRGDVSGTSARAQIRLDFFQYGDGADRVFVRNKEYLEARIDNLISFGERNNVPLYLGEFGLYRTAYEDNRGGIQYSTDMVDIIKARGVHFTYHAYNEQPFGLRYDNFINQPLVEMLRSRLVGATLPTPEPLATVSIDALGTQETGFVTFSGSSSGIEGHLTLTVNGQSYEVTPETEGDWSFKLTQCEHELPNDEFTAVIEGSGSDAFSVNASENFIVATPTPSGTLVTVSYYRQSGNYEDWGLHLWNSAGQNAFDTETLTDWLTPRPFDCVRDGWAEARVPVQNTGSDFNFIVHFGNAKSPDADLRIVPESFGHNAWVVQGNAQVFDQQAAAQMAAANVGNASAALDLSDVAVLNTESQLPPGWNQRANFMEIYVRGYKDSDGDGIGDLQGLISELPYLEALGIEGLWLMPIHESSDNNHGYLVTDYRDIEDDYGTLADFEALLDAAHARGIGIVIDYVVNHSSSSNPLFIDAVSAPDNDKRSWYNFSPEDLGWGAFNSDGWHLNEAGDYHYGAFGGPLPDFNLASPAVEAFHLNNLRFWLNMGVDGFRLDAVGVLFEDAEGVLTQNNPQNYSFLKKMLDVVNQYDNRFMVCEAPNNPASYAGNEVCGHSFAFDTQWRILETVRDGLLQEGFANQLSNPQHEFMPLFLSNHDRFAGGRPMSYFLTNCGDACSHISSSNVENFLGLAASIYLLGSNTPFIYYGEEVGISGIQSDNDEILRPPMSWTDNTTNAGFTTGVPFRAPADNSENYNVLLQNGDSTSLLEHYRALLQLRQANPVLASGELNLLSAANDSSLIFARENGSALAIVAINLTQTPQSFTVTTGLPSTTFTELFPSSGTADSDGTGELLLENVPAQSIVVLTTPL